MAACAFAHVSANCSLVEIPLPQRIAAATFVAEGKVTAQQSYWDASHTMIYTAHTIEIYKIFKGTGTPEYIQLLTQGGTVGSSRITVEPSPELEIGDIGVFTCEPVTRIAPLSSLRNSIPQYEPYASAQGFVKYDIENNVANDVFAAYTGIENTLYPALLPSGARGYREVKAFQVNNPTRNNQPNVSVTAISGFSPTTVTAGTGTILTISGNAFGGNQGTAFVSFKNADDGGATYIQPLPTQYISWSNTQIVVQVPDNAGTGTIQFTRGTTQTSATALAVTYAHQNVDFNPGSGLRAFQTDHNNDNSSGGYTWQMNTAFDADVWAKAAFFRAFNTWRCNTNINWVMGTTTAVNAAANDGVNVIAYDNAVPLAAGVRASCVSYYTSCNPGLNMVWTVSEMDMIFDEGSNIAPNTWQYGPASPSASQYDFESVALHELGHGHQLAHSINNAAVMHYTIAPGVSKRSLDATDLSGGNYVQGKSSVANACGPGAMTNYGVCSPAPVAAFSGTPTSVCVGQSVGFTDQSTNNPTSWVWQFAGGVPATSTLQNPTVTYSTPGTYAVLLSASSSNGSNVNQVAGYITVNPIPTLTITSTPSNGIVCSGSQATLTAGGATTYSWTGGITNGVPFTINNTTTYTVTGTANGCQNTATATITVNPLPAVTATSNPLSGQVCTGSQITLSGGGATSYSWSGGVTDGVAFTPASSGTYTVTGTDNNGCQNTATIAVTVNPLPTVTATSNPTNGQVCTGSQLTLNGGGATSYSWSGGVTDGVAFTPASSGTYTVTGTDNNGCVNTATIGITINALPTVGINANPANGMVCAGTQATLSGTGASSYVWTGGISDGVPFTVISTTTYTVTGTDGNGCVNTSSITLTPAALPIVTATSNPPDNDVLCMGTSVTLNGAGAASYSWSGGVTDGVPFSITASGTFTVTGTDANGCQNTATITHTVIACGPSSIPCGGTYYNMLSQVSATPVVGAVAYRFTFYDITTNAQVAQLTQPSRTLTFGSVNGIYYNTTYRMTVAVDQGSGFSAESHPTCPIVFDVPHPVVPCGNTYQNLNATISASPTSRVTNFLFRFYDNVTGALVAQRSQPSNILVFGLVPGLYNNMTYRYTVTCEYPLLAGGTAFGPESSQSCTVSFGLPFTTVPCGNTYTVLNAVVTAPLSYGAANYYFTFYDNVTGAQVAQRIQPSDVLTLSNVAGIYYANTYRWTVQVEYNVSGGGTAFGPASNSACTVTLGVPTTVVPCNGVYNLATGFASATAKFGATGYRFRFYQGSTLMGQRTQVSRTLTFSTVPGLVNNQSYMWTVEVEYNNGTGIVYGTPSTPCSIGFGTPPPLAPPSHAPEQFTNEGTDGGEVLSLQLYPNPTRDLLNIVTNEPVEAVYVYTITGTLVKSDTQVNQIGLAEFNPGTYVVMVKTASGVQRALVVKE